MQNYEKVLISPRKQRGKRQLRGVFPLFPVTMENTHDSTVGNGKRKWSVLFFAVGAEDDAGGSDSEERTVFQNSALSIAKDFVVNESSCIAGAIPQSVFQPAALVATDVDDAMVHVNAGVNGFDGAMDAIVLHVAADNIVAHFQGKDLLEMEDVLYDHDGACTISVGFLVGVVVFFLRAA